MIYYHEAYRVFRLDFTDEDAGLKVSTELHNKIRKIVVASGAEMLYDPTEDAKILIKIYGSTSAYELLDEVLDAVRIGQQGD